MALDIKGEQSLPVGRIELWRLLNDPEVLAKVIPGCNSVERIVLDRYRMGLKLNVANVSGEYMGEVEIRDKREPDHYVLMVSGDGSIGFLKGEAVFDLEEKTPTESLLRYNGKAEVGGVVAGVGQRVLAGVAKYLVERFFKALRAHIAAAGTSSETILVIDSPPAT